MKDVVLHIGFHKSGTSTIQNFLCANQDVLARRGMLYPQTGRQSMGVEGDALAHHLLAMSCTPRFGMTDALPRMREALLAEAAPYRRILLSSEGFARLRDFEAFDAFFAGFRLTVVVYLRELADYAVAAYQEAVKGDGLVASFAFYLRHFSVNLPLILSLWRARAQRLVIRPFAPALLHGQDLIEDFCQSARIERDGLAPGERRNASIAGNLLSFKLLYNQFMPQTLAVYAAMRDLAERDPRFRGKFFVPDALLSQARASGGRYVKVVRKLFPDMPEPSFVDAPPLFDARRWDADLQQFLGEPALAAARTQPPFHRL